MKHFLITYTFKSGLPDQWHAEIAKFVSALEQSPALKGKISYRAMKSGKGPIYYHLAATGSEEDTKLLQAQDFFKDYTAKNKLISGGTVEVTPLEIIAETQYRG